MFMTKSHSKWTIFPVRFPHKTPQWRCSSGCSGQAVVGGEYEPTPGPGNPTATTHPLTAGVWVGLLALLVTRVERPSPNFSAPRAAGVVLWLPLLWKHTSSNLKRVWTLWMQKFAFSMGKCGFHNSQNRRATEDGQTDFWSFCHTWGAVSTRDQSVGNIKYFRASWCHLWTLSFSYRRAH